MKKKLSQRITSAFLVVVMVLLMLPMNAINISADDDYVVPTTGHKLLSTYNALTGTDISADSAILFLLWKFLTMMCWVSCLASILLIRICMHSLVKCIKEVIWYHFQIVQE